MSLPSIEHFGDRNNTRKRGISFQLKPEGVRYFLADDRASIVRRRRFGNANSVRDISTQYGDLDRRFMLSGEKIALAKKRLVAHTEKFYPSFTIPEDRLHETFAWVAFPMLGAAMKIEKRLAPISVNLQVASGLRAFSLEEMTRAIFGEAPRQLQAASAESMKMGHTFVNIDNLTLGSLLRGYLPPNEMSEVLRMNFGQHCRIQHMDKASAGEIRLLLRRFNPKRIMRLVSEMSENTHGGYTNDFLMLRDAAHQYADARKNHPDVIMDLSRQFRSFQDLHDTITHEYRKLKDPNREILYSDDLIEGLSDISLPDGARLVWPGSTHELLDWSADSVMNNCIFSYGKEAADGRCILLGILDASGKMVVNIMIRGRSVVQCYGKANARCTDEEQIKALFDGLVEQDLINEEEDYSRWVGEVSYRW